jgi:hypothetical protein
MNSRPARALPLLLVLVGVAALAEPAQAQSCGAAAGPPPAGGSASEGRWLAAGKGVARLTEEYEVKDRSFRGSRSVTNDFNESLFISRTALDLRYGLTDDWSADVLVTYPHFTYRIKPPRGVRTERHFRGPGDTFVSAGRRFLLGDAPPPHDELTMLPSDAATCFPTSDDAAGRPLLSVWAGVSIPTGEAQKPNPVFVTRDVSVSNLQTGTGSFDPFLRARIDLPQKGWLLFAEAEVRYPFYENRYDYETADTEAIAVGGGLPLFSRVGASVALLWQRTGRDQFRGDDVGVGGARWIYVVPGITWRVTDDVALDVGLRLPVYRRTETKLSDGNGVFTAGLTVRF